MVQEFVPCSTKRDGKLRWEVYSGIWIFFPHLSTLCLSRHCRDMLGQVGQLLSYVQYAHTSITSCCYLPLYSSTSLDSLACHRWKPNLIVSLLKNPLLEFILGVERLYCASTWEREWSVVVLWWIQAQNTDSQSAIFWSRLPELYVVFPKSARVY